MTMSPLRHLRAIIVEVDDLEALPIPDRIRVLIYRLHLELIAQSFERRS